jgi:C1A family cysteine protease
LCQGRAVALGLWLTRGFFTNPGGHIPVPEPDEARLEGHAVLVVGYDDSARDGQGILIVRNSWGTAWGDGGYGYLPYAHLALGSEAWAVEPAVRDQEAGDDA